MKKVIYIPVLLFFVITVSYGQKIIIHGQETNRKLEWTDFTGMSDKSSPFKAYTWWTMRFKFGNSRPIGDSFHINNIEVTLELDSVKSWVKNEFANEELLKHEQGHFDLGILCMYEVLNLVQHNSFSKNCFPGCVQNSINEVMKKYQALGVQYDAETNHSMNRDQQIKWNAWFDEQFAHQNGIKI